jgi:tRNA pseudouridine55 synthase
MQAVSEGPDGLLLVDKPAGISSHDVVVAVRRRTGARTGHAGTLDPFATGLLLVLLGRATRLARFFVALPKTYRAVARFGAVSSTLDPEGDIRVTGRVPARLPPLPTGRLRQRPPAFSAVKVDGERAYRRARRGERFELPERDVVVHRFEALWHRGERAELEIECSAGTYVRALIADLGDAYCERLRRTRIGPFDVADAIAVPLDEGANDGDENASGRRGDASGDAGLPAPLDLTRALSFMPSVRLGEDDARRVAHGRSVPATAVLAHAGVGARGDPVPPGADAPSGAVVLLDSAGALAVAEPRVGAEGLELKPVVVLRG